MGKKILAVVSEPISGEVIKDAVGSEAAEEAELLVVAPALNSKLRFWVSDPDPAIDRAERVAEESAERMGEEGVDAVADTGESDPLLAIQDALVTFPADEIILCTHPDGEQGWLEDGLLEDINERFSPLPVRHYEIRR